ncbi:hypothetical protein BC941DRAFT_427840 [Chlamydoabsidia padenii]|nr:hypothetical protein BC941DRAFT_427840 [Chlamydoabsidia padenii]
MAGLLSQLILVAASPSFLGYWYFFSHFGFSTPFKARPLGITLLFLGVPAIGLFQVGGGRLLVNSTSTSFVCNIECLLDGGQKNWGWRFF